MKQEEIIEGNKLIAEFMGHSQDDHLYGMVIDGKYYTYTLMKYHSSWDWLMPVVEKIRKTNVNFGYDISFHIMNDECWFGIDNLRHEGFNNHLSDSLISSIWDACVEFITWYNQNKQK